MSVHPVLIAGAWRDSNSTGTFQADDPGTATALPDKYPVSSYQDCEAALDAASMAFRAMRNKSREEIAKFLDAYADRIDARSKEICEMASRETALPFEPRLAGIEMPRTSGQLRQAAEAARMGSWSMPVIDSSANIRSYYAPIGTVAVFGPNNFPLAFGSISGGDFAAAIAAGNPVIAKANSMHPGTTRLLAEEAQLAADETGMPAGIVQLIYRMSHADGEKFVADRRLAAIGYTGSRAAGLKLKAAADTVGKPIYLELSSVNPLVILPGALAERAEKIAEQLVGSCLLGTGQFCTSPGLVLLLQNESTEKFVNSVVQRFSAAPVGTLLSSSGQSGIAAAVEFLKNSGAELLCGGAQDGGTGYRFANTLLRVDGTSFLKNPGALQTEAFGNAAMFVTADTADQAAEIASRFEGNLTGCVYSATDGSDDAMYESIVPHLRQRVGRLLNDKMPTGVAVSAAMNHGGPYPATGHPGFTAVGVPGSMLRFAMLQCFDNVRPARLPLILRDENPVGAWRMIDGAWTTSDVAKA